MDAQCAGDRMNMVSGCGLMVEHLEIKRTRFDSFEGQPNFLVVCAKRRRQQAVNLLHWKHRGFESLHYHHYARNSRKIGYPRVNSEGSTPSSSVADSGRFPDACMVFIGDVAQLVVHPPCKREAVGPSPIISTTFR